MAFLSSLGKYRDIGILVIRVAIGASFLFFHGYPKLLAGPVMWKGVGSAMTHIGIDFYPVVWGFLAALAESLGGLLLILGLFFRPASFFLSFTMLIAVMNHLAAGDGWSGASHALEMLAVCFGLILIGPGKYSVDKR